MNVKRNPPRRRPAAKKARVVRGDTLSETEATLALAAPAASAPPRAIKERLLAWMRCAPPRVETAPPGWRFESAQAEAGWRGSKAPGVRFKTLSVDEARDVVMLLVEIAAGAKFPDHLHEAGGDEGILLSGDVVTGGRLLLPGDYYHAAEGTAHLDTMSPNGCTALVSLTARAWHHLRGELALT